MNLINLIWARRSKIKKTMRLVGLVKRSKARLITLFTRWFLRRISRHSLIAIQQLGAWGWNLSKIIRVQLQKGAWLALWARKITVTLKRKKHGLF